MGREAKRSKPSHAGNGKGEGLALPAQPTSKPEHIFLGLPSGDGNYNGWLCQFTDFLLSLNGRQNRWWFTPCRRIGFKPIDHARNRITKEFLESGASRIWWWDADVKPYQNAAEMLEYQDEIVAGIYPIMRDSETSLDLNWSMYSRNSSDRFNPMMPETEEPTIVDAAATGAMLMRREAFEGMELSPNRWWKNTYGPLGEIEYSDDLEFFTRYRKGVKVLPKVRCGHLKVHDLMLADLLGRTAFKMGKESVLMPTETAGKVILAS